MLKIVPWFTYSIFYSKIELLIYIGQTFIFFSLCLCLYSLYFLLTWFRISFYQLFTLYDIYFRMQCETRSIDFLQVITQLSQTTYIHIYQFSIFPHLWLLYILCFIFTYLRVYVWSSFSLLCTFVCILIYCINYCHF